MMVVDPRRSLASAIAGIDAEALRLRLTLACLADETTGVVADERNDLARMFEISLPTLSKRLKATEAQTDELGRIVVTPLDEQTMTIIVNALRTTPSVETVEVVEVTPKDVIERYRTKYAEKYGAKPRVNYAIALNAAKSMLRKYGDRTMDVVDVAVEQYDVYRSAQYPTPTFGALSTWLCEKVAPIVMRRDETKPAQTNEGIRKEWL